MKVAEALLLRADMQKKLTSLRDRIRRNSVVQEGDKPHEHPDTLLSSAISVLQDFEALVCRINQTNMHSTLTDGRTLMQAIARRDRLVQQHSLLQFAISNTQRENERYSAQEIKWVGLLDVAGLEKQSEDLAVKIRELNAAIQEANWKTELEE